MVSSVKRKVGHVQDINLKIWKKKRKRRREKEKDSFETTANNSRSRRAAYLKELSEKTRGKREERVSERGGG